MALAVVDASVVVKWFVAEPDYEPAQRLQSDFFEGILQLREPAILPWEVMSALRYSGRFPRRDLREAGRTLDRAGFVTIPLFGDYLERTMQIALETHLSIYAASYAGLAAIGQCPLFTADEEFLELRIEGLSVHHIRDYALPSA